MEVVLTLPESLADKIITGLETKADAIATERAKIIASGKRWVDVKGAAFETGLTRGDLRKAAKMKLLAHGMNKGKYIFQLCDLWEFMEKSRVAAKPIV